MATKRRQLHTISNTEPPSQHRQEPYQVYDEQYDKEEHLAELIRPELLNAYRSRLISVLPTSTCT